MHFVGFMGENAVKYALQACNLVSFESLLSKTTQNYQINIE